MNQVKIKIDGYEIECNEGESILNTARANGVFIPAICYLTSCSPTLACKMCMVEVDGKRVYACNAKVKDGLEVIVNTPEIEQERKAIMQAYDVNHPLQCGVCDKSGECELQNYTHYVGVNSQEYALKDEYKSFDSWGKTVYDPNLCIVCERCVTLCKDKIGKSYIKALKHDGNMPSKEYKDIMPKDAYGVWTKFKKSLIGLSGEGDCGDCGECASVCPVGALSIGHFQYRSNAWELHKIPSSCVHCANGCPIEYEVKQAGIGGAEKQVYRVTSDWNFATLCPAGRLAFDVNNQNIQKNENAFRATIAAFKEAHTIAFRGDISNEEALILQYLKEKMGYRLLCDEVKGFSKFLEVFSYTSGNLGEATQKDIMDSTLVICFGGAMSYDMPVVTHFINNAMKQNKGATLAYFHTMEDCVANNFVKPANLIKGIYKPDSEEAFALLLASICIPEDKRVESLKRQIENYQTFIEKEIEREVKTKVKILELDESGNAVLDEEGKEKFIEKEESSKVKETITISSSQLIDYCSKDLLESLEALKQSLNVAKNPILVIGFDIYNAPNAQNIARILGMIERYSGVKILLLAPTTNALGISLICNLDEEKEGYCIGYNTKGDYRIGTSSDNMLIMPYLNEQEGTLVNIDKRVIPISPATPYYGYELNDIAKELCLDCANTIDYTPLLPLEKGFKSVEYDDLEYGFANDGTEIRGYLLNTNYPLEENIEIQPIALKPLREYNLYIRNPMAHFSKQTLKSKYIDSKNGLQISASLAQKLQLSANDRVEISLDHKRTLQTQVIIDLGMEGDFMALGDCEFDDFIGSSRYLKASIKVI